MYQIFHVPDHATEIELAYTTFAFGPNFLLALNFAEWRGMRGVFEHPEFNLRFIEDARLTFKQVTRMAEICRECQAALDRSHNTGNYSYKQLLAALEIAIAHRHGLIGFCD